MNSVLSINGREVQVDPQAANGVYRLIHEIVVAGDVQTVVVDVQANGEPGKLAFLVNAATQVMLYTSDVAAMSKPFYDANVADLLHDYLGDPEEPRAE